jgi:hypothetical protein
VRNAPEIDPAKSQRVMDRHIWPIASATFFIMEANTIELARLGGQHFYYSHTSLVLDKRSRLVGAEDV